MKVETESYNTGETLGQSTLKDVDESSSTVALKLEMLDLRSCSGVVEDCSLLNCYILSMGE